jgi:hypothetical protein
VAGVSSGSDFLPLLNAGQMPEAATQGSPVNEHMGDHDAEGRDAYPNVYVPPSAFGESQEQHLPA